VRLLLSYWARYEMIVDARVWLFLHSVGGGAERWSHEVWQYTGLTGDLDPASLPPGPLAEPYAPVPTASAHNGRGEAVRLGRPCAFVGPAWSPNLAGPLARALVRERCPYESPGEVVHEGLIAEAVWRGAVDAFDVEWSEGAAARAEERRRRAAGES